MAIRATDVLPLVPVMWMTGYWSCGRAEQLDQRTPSSTGVRAQPPPGTRGDADVALEVDVVVEPGPRPRAARCRRSASTSARGRRARRRPGSRRRPRPVERPRDPTRLADVVEPRARTPASSSAARARRPRHLGAHRPLRRALRLADLAEHRGRDVVDARVVAGHCASSSTVGHAARCTEPSCHHDQTSSVTNGRCGANSRRSVTSASASAARADARRIVAAASRTRAASRARGSRRRSPRRTARCVRARAA